MSYANSSALNYAYFKLLETRKPFRDEYTYDMRDRLTTRYSTTGKQTYAYDAAGNMTDKHIYSDKSSISSIKDIHYDFNYQNQLTQVKINGQPVATYQYDTGKQRLYSDTHYTGVDETKVYHWDSAGHIIAEESLATASLTAVSNGRTNYIYAGNDKVAMVIVSTNGSETLYYFINDLQGTPVLITDTSANVVQKIQTDPYGNQERSIGIFPDEVNFTGKKLDPVTGLYYFNQRYYDPEVGRFLSNDPAGQGTNPYQYCSNSPLTYVDPDGEFWWIVAAAVAGALWNGSQHNWSFESIINGALGGASLALGAYYVGSYLAGNAVFGASAVSPDFWTI
ncbi:MAG: RHS repeat-associated core domain-containing protein [Leptolinea sp.]